MSHPGLHHNMCPFCRCNPPLPPAMCCVLHASVAVFANRCAPYLGCCCLWQHYLLSIFSPCGSCSLLSKHATTASSAAQAPWYKYGGGESPQPGENPYSSQNTHKKVIPFYQLFCPMVAPELTALHEQYQYLPMSTCRWYIKQFCAEGHAWPKYVMGKRMAERQVLGRHLVLGECGLKIETSNLYSGKCVSWERCHLR